MVSHNGAVEGRVGEVGVGTRGVVVCCGSCSDSDTLEPRSRCAMVELLMLVKTVESMRTSADALYSVGSAAA